MSSKTDPAHEAASILGPTLRFKGELYADEDLVVRGQVEGSITHTQRLTICRDGHVKADIRGHVIAVEGTVEGDLQASMSVAIMESGHLKGDVHAPSVSIVEGASVNGSVRMSSSPNPGRSRGSPDKRSAAPGEPARINGTGTR
jgi:cytoskeletal protein CcmA (bactofilin family)